MKKLYEELINIKEARNNWSLYVGDTHLEYTFYSSEAAIEVFFTNGFEFISAKPKDVGEAIAANFKERFPNPYLNSVYVGPSKEEEAFGKKVLAVIKKNLAEGLVEVESLNEDEVDDYAAKVGAEVFRFSPDQYEKAKKITYTGGISKYRKFTDIIHHDSAKAILVAPAVAAEIEALLQKGGIVTESRLTEQQKSWKEAAANIVNNIQIGSVIFEASKQYFGPSIYINYAAKRELNDEIKKLLVKELRYKLRKW